MFVVTNRIPVNEAYRDEFETLFRNRARLVDQMSGFIRNEVWRAREGNDYLVTTYWHDEASFRAWTESDAFKQGHGFGGSREMFAGRPTLESFDVILSSERTD
jgi:heme-degrading monooxygenase HmoA